MNKLIGLSFALAISSSAFANTVASVVTIKAAMIGYTLAPEGLVLQMPSGGCLKASDFEVTTRETSPLQVTITQLRSDMCEAYLPYGKNVTFSFADLGVQPGQSVTIVPPKQNTFRVPQGF